MNYIPQYLTSNICGRNPKRRKELLFNFKQFNNAASNGTAFNNRASNGSYLAGKEKVNLPLEAEE